MKIRSGFVSNSSSSSFIIGLAKVVDKTVAEDWLSSLGAGPDCKIATVESLKNEWRCEVTSVYNQETQECDRYDISVESFMGDRVQLHNLSANDYVLLVDLSYGDDSDFWNGDDYDYDIDLEFFPGGFAEVYTAIVNGGCGLEASMAYYGAGRDG